MDISTQTNRDLFVIHVAGKFTFDDHAEFRRQILAPIEDGDFAQVTMDMQNLEFVDSAGLGMLLLALDATQKTRKKLLLTGAQGQVRKILDLTKFHTFFEIL